jgi:lipopolysaccharide/colanic/teichoic acid biosynthesis glycosyltransferase
MKRIFDVFSSACGLLLSFPLFIFSALWIRMDSPGSIFFRQERVGQRGRPFFILKFRTMVDRPDEGRQITVGQDPRITKSGAFLRSTKLDELPQLINVLRGDMSVVGPRPEVPRYVAHYTDTERRVLDLKPGITDLASIKYRHESEILAKADDPDRIYIDQVMRDKLAINLEYAERAGFLADLGVIFQTLAALFRKAPK